MAASCTYHLPTVISLLLNKSHTKNPNAYQKIFESFLEKKSGEWTISRKSKRTRQKKREEKIGKGNQMTALRIQTGEGHQTFPASQRAGKKERKIQNGCLH